MKRSPVRGGLLLVGAAAVALAGCTGSPDTQSSGAASDLPGDGTTYTTREVTDGTTTFTAVINPNGGKNLSYVGESGFGLLDVTEDGFTYAFKDMNSNGTLDPWEDWRLDPAERAADLAPQLTTEQIAGLMLFSPTEAAIADGLTDMQRAYLGEDHLRLVLNGGSNDVLQNVTWSNQMQAYVESVATAEQPYVPVNISTDPRSDPAGGYFGVDAAGISLWPGNLGLAATFDPEHAREFGKTASLEYRALGMTNVLSPQVDVASDPRWARDNGTFGESPELSRLMAEAFIDGFQSTYDEAGNNLGWGEDSVAATIKHFAGDSAGEGGRASYTDEGKFAVFPGDNFDEHLIPFMENGLSAAGLMTSYSISVDGKGQPLFGVRMGSAYAKELVDILRVDSDYNGVIMTDWGVTAGGITDPNADWSTAWGVEELTVEERHFLVLKTGIDMFGGNSDAAPVMAAYDMWQKAFEAGDLDIDADTRFIQSAERILGMIFTSGLYENPFLDLEESKAIVGSPDKIEAGFEAQLDSVVMAKNAGVVSCGADNPWADKTVYIPQMERQNSDAILKDGSYAYGPSVDLELAAQYFGKVVTDQVEVDSDGYVTGFTTPDLSDVDVALVGMKNPDNDAEFWALMAGTDARTGDYIPISLQYRPYTADSDAVRKVSIAGDLLEDGTQENRSYFGKTSIVTNEGDLDAFERAAKAVEDSGKDIPVMVLMRAENPVIPTEFEPKADVIAVGFSIADEAILQVMLGLHESVGRLPMIFPADMETVEASKEDVPFDTDPYVDSEGSVYDFGFGLNCEGAPIE